MAFEALKERQSEVWGAGRFEVVAPHIADMHDALVEALGVVAGETWLDVGCGTGAIAERAAARGARVTGADLAPRLVETAARRAHELGLDIEYGVGDVENLPFPDASFDVVVSSVGAIFAPDHARTARELARVTRPGGRLGLTAWTPEGRNGELFRLLAPFQPPLPEGAGTPLQWGSEAYVEGLLGDVFELELSRRLCVDDVEGDPDAAWAEFSTAFGPVATLLRMLPPERGEELRRTWIAYAEPTYADGRMYSEAEYLLVLGRRR